MKVLVETAAGFALFTLREPGILKEEHDISKEYNSADKMSSLIKLSSFSSFKKSEEALLAMKDINESKLPEQLENFLKKQWKGKSLGEELAVCDAKLGSIIKEKLGITTLHNDGVVELMRGIRAQISELIRKISDEKMRQVTLGLSHSYARYKLKFSSKKIDAMVIQAISLLDDLDKELNSYAMKCKEWYGWHFPELARVVPKNITYVKCVKALGFRSNIEKASFEDVLTHEEAEEVKSEALVSKGTEISEDDLANIFHLCDQIISLTEYRADLEVYVQNRMQAIAPNFTALIGDLVAARLLAKAGGLQQLAKQPASTIQILGAEKALFRAIKSKKPTPKYGLIYHATLVKDCDPKLKGKFSRKLAAKAALSVRNDAFAEREGESNEISEGVLGAEYRDHLIKRLRRMEAQTYGKEIKSTKPFRQYDSGTAFNASSGASYQRVSMKYDENADITEKRIKPVEMEETHMEIEEEQVAEVEANLDDAEPSSKKRKRKVEEVEDEVIASEVKAEKKKKKKKKKDKDGSGKSKGKSKTKKRKKE